MLGDEEGRELIYWMLGADEERREFAI